MNQLLNHSSRKDLVKETSMLFQSFNLLGNINVLDNVLLPVKLRRRLGPSDYEKARDLLKYVGLSNYEKAYIKTLSGGQKQRVAIARTLITNPKIILCDEPTSALDEQMSYEVLKLLKDINKSFDTTIVIVSHDIGVIRATCNRVAVLENGRIMDIIPLKPEKMVPISYKEAFISD
jgi:D-methionine transport system ATP-binding protein